MIEGELEAALSRRRYARCPKGVSENADGASGITGHRNGHRSLLGTFGRVKLLAGEALLGGGDNSAIFDQRGRAVVIKRRDAKDVHCNLRSVKDAPVVREPDDDHSGARQRSTARRRISRKALHVIKAAPGVSDRKNHQALRRRRLPRHPTFEKAGRGSEWPAKVVWQGELRMSVSSNKHGLAKRGGVVHSGLKPVLHHAVGLGPRRTHVQACGIDHRG
jgi:hypothetical protein